MKRLIVRSIAESGIREAVTWYDHERSPRIAVEFLDSLEATFHQICENPKMFAVVEREIRRAPVARFPYGVFYVDGPDYVPVLAVLHLARNPATWQERL